MLGPVGVEAWAFFVRVRDTGGRRGCRPLPPELAGLVGSGTFSDGRRAVTSSWVCERTRCG